MPVTRRKSISNDELPNITLSLGGGEEEEEDVVAVGRENIFMSPLINGEREKQKRERMRERREKSLSFLWRGGQKQ